MDAKNIKIAVIYQSTYGHTKVVAEEILKGIDSTKLASGTLIKVEDIEDPETLNKYDCMVFGAPTYMGSMSAPFKVFMDKTSKVWMKQEWKDKFAAGFTNSGHLSGDKFNTLTQLFTLASQHSMIWISLGILYDNSDPKAVINRLGSYNGLMTQSDSLDASKTPPTGDKLTAQKFGVRIAQKVKQFLK